MMRRNALIVAGIVIAVAAIMATMLDSRSRIRATMDQSMASSNPSSVVPGPAVTFSLREGAVRAYRWSMSATVSPVSPGMAPPGNTSFSGTLNVRVIPGDTHPALAVQITPLNVVFMGQPNEKMAKVFSTPFLVDIEPNGKLGATRFASGLAPANRASLDSAIRSLEMVLPKTPAERWEASETDRNGDYLASYEVDAPSGEIVKHKIRYVPRKDSLFSAVVEASSVRARIDPDGTWLARSEGTERVTLSAGGKQVIARVNAHFRLEPLPDPPNADLALWRDDVLAAIHVTVDDLSDNAPSAWDEEQLSRARAKFLRDGITLDGLVRKLASGTEDATLPGRLAEYLRALPDEARAIPAKLRRLPDSVAGQVLGALQAAGTPQAQAALADVFESKVQTRDNRLRALFALAGVEYPAADVIERVARAAGRSRGRLETQELASTALLVLGALTQKAPEEVRSRIIHQFEDDLHAAKDARDERLFLLALGNARTTLAADTLRVYLRSSNTGVREAAAYVAANGTDASAADELIGLFEHDAEATVRHAAMEGFLRRPPDARENEAIARVLVEGREPEARIRAQMVEYLANHMKEFPENRQILQAHLKHETDREVTVAILNSLVH